LTEEDFETEDKDIEIDEKYLDDDFNSYDDF